MKKMFLAVMLVICMVSAALAENPYIAVVGNDKDAKPFYFSDEDLLHMYDQNQLGVPVCDFGSLFPDAYNMPYHPSYEAGCEQFRCNAPVIQPEVCDDTGTWYGVRSNPQFVDHGNKNARVSYSSAGWYEWYVRLPFQPTGDISLVLRCGVLIGGGFSASPYDREHTYYAYTGADLDESGIIPGSMIVATLPKITAKAFHGPYNTFAPFKLTASIINEQTDQLLNGSVGTRIVLDACKDTTIVVTMPLDGHINSAGQREKRLKAGDLIYVRMDIPRHVKKYTDLYCHEQSLKVMGE